MLPFVLAGLTTGSVFALAATGLVLTYKTSGIFNVAHGALASVGAFLFYFLNVQQHIPWPVAAAICVFVAGPGVGLVLEGLTRRLQARPLTVTVLGTVGLLLVVQGGIDLVYTPGVQRSVPQYLPTAAVDIFGTPVAVYRLIIIGLALAVAIALTLLLRYTQTGLAMSAVVDDPVLLELTGTDPVRVRRIAWMIGSCTATLSGVLLVPLLQLDSTALTLLIVTAFGAAALGAFTNLPLVYAGGLVLGVAQALLQKYFVDTTSLLGGLSAALPFLLLFLLLVAAPRLRSPISGAAVRRTATTAWRPPPMVRGAGAVALLTVLAAVPLFAGFQLNAWTRFLAYGIVFLSLGLLVRLSGQVSLAHVSFMVIGVVVFGHVTAEGHWPWLIAVLVAGLAAAPVGALLAIPAIRFPGLYLALATLGFGLLLQAMFYNQSYLFGALGLGLTIPRPETAGLTGDTGYYYVVLAFAVAVALLVLALENGRLGRLLRAMADSPTGLSANGASINVSKVLVFCLSASLAAIGGVLDGATTGYVGPDGYQPITSLQLFALAAIAIGRLPWYAAVAAAGQVLVPAYVSNEVVVTSALTVAFGVATVVAAIQSRPATIPGAVRRILDRIPAPRRRRTTTVAAVRHQTDAIRLNVDNAVVRYGGLVAVDGVTVEARAGTVTGLIGPNGAGKTTVFNACSGLVRPASGTVTLNGEPIGRLGPAARARRGLGRTFQRMELFETLTVRENVAMGREARYAGWNPCTHLISPRGQRREIDTRAEWAISLCGIEELAVAPVWTLSTGQRRLVELARCLAGDFGLLLLDEPSSGLDHEETARFGDILATIAEDGAGILLVEHDLTLITRLCSQVYVLDFGKPIIDGTPQEVLGSAVVRQAYLGQKEITETRR
ncbi:ABC transporter permease subunit [Amycolatopsis pigmentata]|uniref:ATP-binding cassette domain-containing protein n=1 Tax=Amycolatopsis pigmentata TaxID=450801 RepID=A0ABW5G7Z3_9PSEU